MTKDNSESFEEYCKLNNRDYGCQSSWEEKIFNDQQKKIDELQLRLNLTKKDSHKKSVNNIRLEKELQAAEEELSTRMTLEDGIKLTKQLKALEEENRILREAVELANEALDYYEKHYESAPTYRSAVMDGRFSHCKATVRQALEKTKRGGE